MRGSPSVLALLVILLASQAAGQAATPLAEDPTGDVNYDVGGAEAGSPPADRGGNFDLVGLAATETKETVVFTLHVADLQPGSLFLVEDTQYAIHFTHNQQAFRLVMFRFEADAAFYYARLERQSADDGTYDWIDWPPVQVDVAAGTLTAEVYRDDLRDAQGAAPYPGRTLEAIHVETSSAHGEDFIVVNDQRPGFPLQTRDRMPDEGTSLQVLEFQEGLRQTGHALLWTDRPMRASNGEASTFVFTIRAKNTGDAADSFELQAWDVPTGWHVSLPEQVVRLDGGETREVPVIVSTPFAHQHGSQERFQVTMTSRTDSSSVGRAELGIYYHEVPQPAGHHDIVHFHSAQYWAGPTADVQDLAFSGGSRFTYFNTLEEDPNDKALSVSGRWMGYATFDGNVPPHNRWVWESYLSPGLVMGLDVDLDGTLALSLPVQTDFPLPQATVSGRLYRWTNDEAAGTFDSTDIAVFPATSPTDLMPGVHVLEWEVAPNADADLLPYTPRQGLIFEFFLDAPAPKLFTGADAPKLAPGGRARLPLLEYRDPVQDQYAAHEFLHFTAPGAASVNPGDTRILEGALHNAASGPFRYQITLEGVNADWATLLVPATGTLATDGTLPIRIAVLAPEKAADGEAADLAVSVSSRDDPTVRAIGRFFVAVDTESEHPDDSAQAVLDAPSKDSPPGATALVLLVVLAVAATMAGRRRDL